MTDTFYHIPDAYIKQLPEQYKDYIVRIKVNRGGNYLDDNPPAIEDVTRSNKFYLAGNIYSFLMNIPEEDLTHMALLGISVKQFSNTSDCKRISECLAESKAKQDTIQGPM